MGPYDKCSDAQLSVSLTMSYPAATTSGSIFMAGYRWTATSTCLQVTSEQLPEITARGPWFALKR